VEATERWIEVRFRGVEVASTRRAQRVLETSHAPVYYIPPEDVRLELLIPTAQRSFCEWKGTARYFDLEAAGERVPGVAWSYPDPAPGFEPIRDSLAFYPHLLECLVDGERATAQPGAFYGGWVTSHVVGPFKGGPGTQGW